MKITQADLETAQEQLLRARGMVARMKESVEETVESVIRTVEVTGTSLGFGIARGYTGGIEVVNAPVELIAGGGLHLLQLLGGAGKVRSHVAAVGDGALASWGNTLGVGIGARLKAKSAAGAGAQMGAGGHAGSLPMPPAHGGITGEIAEMAARAAR